MILDTLIKHASLKKEDWLRLSSEKLGTQSHSLIPCASIIYSVIGRLVNQPRSLPKGIDAFPAVSKALHLHQSRNCYPRSTFYRVRDVVIIPFSLLVVMKRGL